MVKGEYESFNTWNDMEYETLMIKMNLETLEIDLNDIKSLMNYKIKDRLILGKMI